MKTGVAAALVFLMTGPAMAQPAPAGKCSLIDNGVAQVAPTMREEGLHSLSTPLPKRIDDAVADVTFRIQSDGTVADVKFLCVTVSDREVTAAIAKAVGDWRFVPVTRDGRFVTASATYRISTAGAIPLSFVPMGLHKIET